MYIYMYRLYSMYVPMVLNRNPGFDPRVLTDIYMYIILYILIYVDICCYVYICEYIYFMCAIHS